MSLSLYLLGSTRVVLDEASIEVKPRKALALLIYLAVTAEQHARDALATLLWPDSDQHHARHSLRSRLSELNKILGDDWLEADRERVGLQSGYWLDVTEFQQMLAAKNDSSSSLIAAADLYRDDFLTGFTLPDCPKFDEWQLFQTESLRQSLGFVLERLVGILSKRGDYETAVAYARRQLALDPLHEPAHRQLMQLYVQTGQRTAALRQYDQCQQILDEELGIAPSLETNTLYQDIQDGKVTSRTRQPSPRHNLPVQTTTFIGREQEIADIKRLLLDEPGCRLLTLVGPGGIGKTRLALATAVQLLNAFPNGTYFVSLASVTEAEDIVPAMATALNLTFYGQREPKEQLLDYLRSKKLLIVADNFEHLLGKSHLFTEIISQAPEVSLLVTSRERLNLQEEWSYDVQGLSFPVGLAAEEVEATQGLETYSSLKLFLQRASRATASFTPTPEETADIIRICQLVQGMPLGIELAASWARAMTCREIADEIEHNLDFLTTPLRNIPERHRSLRVVFEQTWDRLSLEEQTVLQQLSVFRGGCTREAAEHVTGATLSALSALIDKALLHRTNTGRYELHELIRQFAEGKLSAIDQAKTTRDAHCTYFANFLYQRESDLKGRRQKTAANEIETDIENVRIAWNWAVEQAHVELLSQALGGLGLAYEWYGRYQEGERTYDYATKKLTEIKTSQGQGTLINILIWQARFGEVLGKNDHASQLLHQAQALLETPALATQDTRSEQTAILMGLGRVAYNHGDFRTAEQFYEQSLALYRKLNDRWEEAQALLALEGVGRNHLESGDLKKFQQQAEASKQLVLESLVIFRSLGDQANVARGNLVLGFVFMTLGQGIEAQLALEECITICKDLGRSNSINLIWATGTLGLIKGWYFGLYEQMRAEAQVMRDLAQELGFSEGTMLGLGYTGLAALAQGAYQETQQIFQEFVVLGQPKGDRNNLASNLAILGFATRKLGDKIQAHHYLAKSLQISLEIRAFRGALYGLPLAALLLADYGDIERAIEVQALVWSFPIIANSHWCEDVAGRHLTAVANTIPANVVAAAQTRGQKRNLWTTIEELLAVFIEDEPDGDS